MSIEVNNTGMVPEPNPTKSEIDALGISAGTLNGYTISVVAEVPTTPVANTIYLVEV